MHIHVHIRVHAHAHAHHVHALVATCLVAAVPSVAHGRSPRCTRSQPVVRTAAGVDDLKVAIDRKDIKKTTAALGIIVPNGTMSPVYCSNNEPKCPHC